MVSYCVVTNLPGLWHTEDQILAEYNSVHYISYLVILYILKLKTRLISQ